MGIRIDHKRHALPIVDGEVVFLGGDDFAVINAAEAVSIGGLGFVIAGVASIDARDGVITGAVQDDVAFYQITGFPNDVEAFFALAAAEVINLAPVVVAIDVQDRIVGQGHQVLRICAEGSAIQSHGEVFIGIIGVSIVAGERVAAVVAHDLPTSDSELFRPIRR